MSPIRLFIIGSLLLTACTSTAAPAPPFGLPPLNLPADEAPHDAQTEWWYFNMHLLSDSGQSYALHDVLFQVQELDSDRTIYVRQIGMSDVNANRQHASERVRLQPSPITTDPNSFRFDIGPSLMEGVNGEYYRLTASVGPYEYDLSLRSTTPPLAHGGIGLLEMGEAGVTYYYSRPRLAISGHIFAKGSLIPVSGLGWFDKQWGDFQPVTVTWDWASVQLVDGTDLMVSRLYDRSNLLVNSYATIRRNEESPVHLDADAFELRPAHSKTWTSDRTGTRYVTDWVLSIPEFDINVVMVPKGASSEFVSPALGVNYWESPVTILGADSRQELGQGFIELNWQPDSAASR